MFEPYEGKPDNFGMAVVDKEEMVEFVSLRQRLRVARPASTPSATRRYTMCWMCSSASAAEEAARGMSRSGSRRHRIEHVQIIHPLDVGRLAELDVIASMQPIHATSDMATADRYWGATQRICV